MKRCLISKQRRTFSPEFKRSAASLVLDQSYNHVDASRSVGVAESYLTFVGPGVLLAMLTSKRLDLLRHADCNGALTVRALADALGRDYTNVRVDVAELEAAELLVRDEHKVVVP